MKRTSYLPIAAFCFLAASCGGAQQAEQTSGIELSSLDTTVKPGTDFYQYATGGWQKSHPLPAEYSRYGSFDQLAETNQKRLNELIEELSTAENAAGTNAQKIADFYNTAMDSVKLNEQRFAPVQEDLDEVAEQIKIGRAHV